MHAENQKGYFITFEGPEGSGKSTQVNGLASFLREKGLTVITTREPGGTDIGEEIRTILHSNRNHHMSVVTEALLYQAARAQLVRDVIRPALSLGHIVLSDRYGDSSTAYQGGGRELGFERIQDLNAFSTSRLVPDLTFFIHVPINVGMMRRRRSGKINRMDAQTNEFYNRVESAYQQLMNDDTTGRWVQIDGTRPVPEVGVELTEVTTQRLKARGIL